MVGRWWLFPRGESVGWSRGGKAGGDGEGVALLVEGGQWGVQCWMRVLASGRVVWVLRVRLVWF